MEILYPRQQANSLQFILPFASLAIIAVLLLLPPSRGIWANGCALLAFLYMCWLAYRFLFLRRLIVIDGGTMYIRSYFRHERYRCRDVTGITIKRGDPMYHFFDVRVLKLTTVSGKKKTYIFPDFPVRDFDRLLLHIGRP